MRITVLGKSPSWQDADGACSGYLIEEDGFHLLLDCGNGVFSKLRRFIDYVDVDAVVISHLHADHFLDLVPYSYALTYAPRQQPVPVDRWPGTDCPACPELHVPPGATALFRRVVGAWGNEDLIENAFAMREYDPADALEIGPLRVRFQPVPHFTADQRGRDRLRQRRRAHHLRRRPRPDRCARRVRARHRPADHRGHAAAPGARRPARPRDARRGRRARPPGGRAAGRADPLLRRARGRLGAPRGRGDLRRGRSRSPARAPPTTL